MMRCFGARWRAAMIGLMAVVLLVSAGRPPQPPLGVRFPMRPGMVKRMTANKKTRAQALLARAKQKFAAADQIKNGPCRCGASSHAACKTPKACEPIEEAQMKALRKQGGLAKREALRILLGARDLNAATDPSKAFAKLSAEDLRKKLAERKVLLGKLENELTKVCKRSPEELRLRLTGLELLSVAKRVTDDLAQALPPDQRETFTALSSATVATIEAITSKDSDKVAEAFGRLTTLAKLGLSRLPGLAPGPKKWLKGITTFYNMVISLGATYAEWNKGHDVTKLKVGVAGLISQTSEILQSYPPTKLGATVFSGANDIASYGILAWHIGGAAKAMKLNLNMNRKAQTFLDEKIHEVRSQISYMQQELGKHE